MAKKKTIENESLEVELTETTETVTPITETEQPALLRGYIRIKKVGKESQGVVIHSKDYGENKTYKPTEWEMIDAKKK